MSQNQSYFWQTTRHNVYLKRSAKYHMLMVLMVILTFSTVCPAEIEPKFNDDARVVQTEEVTKMMIQADNAFNNNGNEQNVVDSPNRQKPDATSTKGTTGNVGNLGFIHAFIASISVILVSELGDKTFFIAAIMAMRHARLTVFTGAIAALGLMTVLSAVFGMAATIIPRVYTYYISTALFAIFGLKMLKEGYYMKATDAQEELEEVQSDLKKREDELKKKLHGGYDETDVKGKRKNSNPDDAADAIGSRLSSNSEMQHRQRKQLTSSTSANINIDDADSDKEDENSSQRRAMLPMSVTVSMNDFHDKPTTSKMSSFNSNRSLSTGTTATPVATSQHYDNKASGDASMNDGDAQSSVRSTVDPGVHSTSLRYSMDLNVTDNINNNSLSKSNSTGQTNGKICNTESAANSMELKQLGNKKWRDREVSSTVVQDPESGVRKNVKRSGVYLASRIFMQAFTMTFLAEWGDRSQLTTIILSAREDVYGVIIGGVLGHSVCTGLAVIGGRMIAQKISVRTVTIVGGVVFLLFAITSLFMSPDEDA